MRPCPGRFTWWREALSSNTSALINAIGTTQNTAPLGSPYVLVSGSGIEIGGAVTVTLQFSPPTSGVITDSLTVISGQP